MVVASKSQVKVYLPDELHGLLNADSRPNSEVVESALWSEFGGERKAVVEVRLENKRNQLQAALGTLEDERENVTELKEEIAQLEDMVDRVDNHEEQRRSDIDDLLGEMERTGRHIWPDSNAVQNLASEHFHGDKREAFDKIQERAESDHFEISPKQFTKPGGI